MSSSLGLCPFCSLKRHFTLGDGEGLDGPKRGNSQVGMGWEKEIPFLSHGIAEIPGRVVVCVAEKKFPLQKSFQLKKCVFIKLTIISDMTHSQSACRCQSVLIVDTIA